jgi:hypothetical protein
MSMRLPSLGKAWENLRGNPTLVDTVVDVIVDPVIGFLDLLAKSLREQVDRLVVVRDEVVKFGIKHTDNLRGLALTLADALVLVDSDD